MASGRENGSLDYVESGEKNQLCKLLLAHAFHVGFDCLDDLLSVLVDRVVSAPNVVTILLRLPLPSLGQ